MPQLKAALAAFAKAARVAHPDWLTDEDAFLGFVTERVPPGAPREALRALHAPDLLLTWACLASHRPALDAFDALVVEACAHVRRRGRAFDALGEELDQTLRQKLLVARPGSAPKLRQYNGSGPLVGWLRVVAARTAISLTRGGGRAALPPEDRDERAIATPDAELQFIRAQYRQPFKAAFRAALGALSAEHRLMLRLHFVEGFSHEQIARMQQVHQTTVTRRIAAARGELFEGIHRHLAEHLQMDRRELASLVRLVRSELEVSLTALLPTSQG